MVDPIGAGKIGQSPVTGAGQSSELGPSGFRLEPGQTGRINTDLGEAAEKVRSIRSEYHDLNMMIQRLMTDAKAQGNPLQAQLLEVQLKIQDFGLRVEMASRMLESGIKSFNDLLKTNV